MQHKTAWNFSPAGSNRLRELVKPAGSNRLRELLKLYACADLVAPVDVGAFGKRAGELLTRVAFNKRAGWLLTPVSGEQHVRRAALKIDRVRPGGPPRLRMPSTHAPITLKRKAAQL